MFQVPRIWTKPLCPAQQRVAGRADNEVEVVVRAAADGTDKRAAEAEGDDLWKGRTRVVLNDC